MIFIFHSINMMYPQLHILNHPCIPRIISIWSCRMTLLMCYWIQFVSILLSVFAHIFLRDVCWPAIYFSYSSLIWLWHYGNVGLIKWVWVFLSLQLFGRFLKELTLRSSHCDPKESAVSLQSQDTGSIHSLV